MKRANITLDEIYNLVLNTATREWERTQLLKCKSEIENGTNNEQAFSELEYRLRPLAVRNNLTPDVAEFYTKLSGKNQKIESFDLTKHFEEDAPGVERAIFAGGCFWCMVEPFETRPGIIAVISGYTGGQVDNPTYEIVSRGTSGHVEAVEIIYDSKLISYETLVGIYWQLIDPTDDGGQINDRGANYKPIIFVNNDEQKEVANKSRKELEQSRKYSKPIIVPIRNAEKFWPAENYHQDFYKKNRVRYRRIENSRRQYLTYLKVKGWIKRKFSRE
ncbi:peptide-methionine (S)-S-oxide reductase MsrA [Liquorilactobacillus hordei]|uniref:Peptide methionine sulfoxide reductase MsrA n=1 Tax=Liquorilactobacillus hordei TaxID=468911 RepID=A0A3Q8CD39_9LACO|nr:peptide-methionine (S)-S-oxide reductase MsrA [Liquorilactobacillus hordei]AUJ29684.1 peptide-methionine (S)-S-oxide reductase [Liquorilactobacillus hordei]